MQKNQEFEKSAWIIAFCIFLGLGLFLFFGDFNLMISLLIAAGGLLSLVLLLFFKSDYYYLVLIGLIPLSQDLVLFGGAKLSLPSEAMLVLLLVFLLLFSARYWNALKVLIRHPFSMLLLLDLFVELISGILGTHPDVSIKRVAIRLIFIGGFYFITASITSPKKLYRIWIAYAIGLLPVMYFTLLKHSRYNFDPRVVFSMCQPYFNDHTVYGACLAFLIPILLIIYLRRKSLGWNMYYSLFFVGLVLLVFVSEILALSRAAILSVVFCFIFYLLLKWKMQFKTMLFGLALLSILSISFSDEIIEQVRSNNSVSNDGELKNHFSSVTNINSDASNLERINRWICAYRMFEAKPILGFGPGTYQFEYNQFQTLENKTYISTNMGDAGNAHSEYLTYLSETGIIGFIVFLLIVLSSIYFGMQNNLLLEDKLLKSINLGVLLGLVTFYFHGIFNSFLDQSKMAFLVYAALGTIITINLTVKKQGLIHETN